MNSRQSEIIYYENNESLNGNIVELDVDYSKIVIPFSKMYKSSRMNYLYSGDEKIPFKERDPDYRLILHQEFSKFRNPE